MSSDSSSDEERRHALEPDLLLRPARRVEQRTQRIQIPVRGPGELTTRAGLPAQPPQPRRLRPQRPHHLVRRGTGGHDVPCLEQPLAQRREPRLGRRRLLVEQQRIRQRVPQQLVRRARQPLTARGIPVAPTQYPGQPPQLPRIHRPQRRQRQRPDDVDGQRLGISHRPQREQHRPYGGLTRQRQLVTRDVHRDPGRRQRTSQRRDRTAAGPNQHGHLVPPDAVLHMRPPQQVGDVLELGATRRVEIRPRPSPDRTHTRTHPGCGTVERLSVERPRYAEPVHDDRATPVQRAAEPSGRLKAIARPATAV